jgi:hypothetical protein
MDRVFADSKGTDIFDRAVFIDVGRLHFGGHVNREGGNGTTKNIFFDVLLTVHLSIILAINQLSAQNLRALCAHHQEVKIVSV